MLDRFTAILRCPVCSTALAVGDVACVCAHGHSFDRAREGYVHVRRSKRTGDSKEMLRARRDFLNRGYYRPLADLVCDTVAEYLGHSAPRRDNRVVLDAGCGEGYYLARLIERLAAPSGGNRYMYLGIDASSEAARMTARRCRDALCMVADLQETLPLADETLDVVVNIFSPRRIAEFARVLVPGGLLLIALPAPDHLRELRETLQLLSIEELKEERINEHLAGLFTVARRLSLTYTIALDEQALGTFIDMTPNYRHQKRLGGSSAVAAARPIQIAFVLLACTRT